MNKPPCFSKNATVSLGVFTLPRYSPTAKNGSRAGGGGGWGAEECLGDATLAEFTHNSDMLTCGVIYFLYLTSFRSQIPFLPDWGEEKKSKTKSDLKIGTSICVPVVRVF